MDAKEFLLKVQRICDENICLGCPLLNLNCGIVAPGNIDSLIAEVENYKPKDEPMKIIVEVEVPGGETCHNCNSIYYMAKNTKCIMFNCKLNFYEDWLKCPACLAACQKAIEQKAEMEQIRRAKTERVKYCVAHGIPCEEEE